MKLVSNASFNEAQEVQYQNLAYSQKLIEDNKALKGIFNTIYDQAHDFTSKTLNNILDTPYKVNTVTSFAEAVAKPVNDNSCFAVKGKVKAQLETQKDTINKAFADQYTASVTDATKYFNGVKAEISAAKITVNNAAECNAVVDSITQEAIDLFAASISGVDHDIDFYANNSNIKSAQDSFKQDLCVTDLSTVVNDINSGLEVLGQINLAISLKLEDTNY